MTAATSLSCHPSYSFGLSSLVPSILSPLWTLAPLICCLLAPSHAVALTTIPHSLTLPQHSFFPLHPLCHFSTCLFLIGARLPFLLLYSVRTVLHYQCIQTPHFLLHLPSLTSFFSPSLSLRASKECQNKERLVEQRFRAALRDFQQWLVNAKISTAKCFDVPQSVAEASTALQRIQARHLFHFALIYHEHILNSWYVLKTVVAEYLQSLPQCSLLISHETHVFFPAHFPVFCLLLSCAPGSFPRTDAPDTEQQIFWIELHFVILFQDRK